VRRKARRSPCQSIGDGRHHDGCSFDDRLHQSRSGRADGLAIGRCHGPGPVEEIFRAFHEETCEPLENPLSVAIRRIRARSSRFGRCCSSGGMAMSFTLRAQRHPSAMARDM